MKSLLKESATSLTALVFLVVGGSGVALFFHLFEAYVKEMHEILGLVFVAAALLHLYFNWNGMKRYFPKKLFLGYAGVVVLAAVLFMASVEEGPNPKRTLIDKSLTAPLALSLPLLGTDLETARVRLAEKEITIGDAASLLEIAKNNKTSPFAIVSLIAQ